MPNTDTLRACSVKSAGLTSICMPLLTCLCALESELTSQVFMTDNVHAMTDTAIYQSCASDPAVPGSGLQVNQLRQGCRLCKCFRDGNAWPTLFSTPTCACSTRCGAAGKEATAPCTCIDTSRIATAVRCRRRRCVQFIEWSDNSNCCVFMGSAFCVEVSLPKVQSQNCGRHTNCACNGVCKYQRFTLYCS